MTAIVAAPEDLRPVPNEAAAADDRSFFGHPKGLAYLAFTEAWERFSFYGMSALLLLYMIQRLLLPEVNRPVVKWKRRNPSLPQCYNAFLTPPDIDHVFDVEA